MELAVVGAASVVLGFILQAVPQPGSAALEQVKQLLEAAREGKVSAITSLVDSGLAVDAVGEHGETALMVAAGAGQPAAVELLLSMGASVAACASESVPTTPGLAAGGTCTHAAAAAPGSDDVLSLLLDRDAAAVQASDAMKNTPLHVACIHGREGAVQLCLARGALPDEKNGAGCTPLALAASHGSVDALRLLLEHGADVHATDAEGNSALVCRTKRLETRTTQPHRAPLRSTHPPCFRCARSTARVRTRTCRQPMRC
jgi:ankyrin repeat protein